MSKVFISIVTPTYNEESNIRDLYAQIKLIMNEKNYNYEHIIIDNASNDQTLLIAKEIASTDKKLKIIVNQKNFGWVRSFYYGLLQAKGDAVIMLASDMQDPPAIINEYIKKWENGSKIVLARKKNSGESFFLTSIKKTYYRFIKKISNNELTLDTNGYGLFDKEVVNKLKKIDDYYPYFRGLITEFGYKIDTVDFFQPARSRGKSKMNFYLMYDIAMLGIIKHSKAPLRIMTIIGFIASICSILIATLYLFYKIFNWNSFQTGTAPILIGIFIIGSIQIFLLGLVGEYVGSILTEVRKIPLVFEKERINFD